MKLLNRKYSCYILLQVLLKALQRLTLICRSTAVFVTGQYIVNSTTVIKFENVMFSFLKWLKTSTHLAPSSIFSFAHCFSFSLFKYMFNLQTSSNRELLSICLSGIFLLKTRLIINVYPINWRTQKTPLAAAFFCVIWLAPFFYILKTSLIKTSHFNCKVSRYAGMWFC